MNILITYENFNCGGAESRIFTIAKALLERSHKVVIISKHGDYVKFFEELGGIHYNIDFKNIYDLKNMIKIIRDIINKEKIDILHLNPYFSLIAPVFASIYENKQFVVTFHGVIKNIKTWSENSNIDFFYVFLKDFVFKYSKCIISVSPEVTNFLKEEFGVKDNKIKYIPQFIDDNLFKNNSQDNNQKLKFLLVSRIDEDKMISINEALNFFKYYKLKYSRSSLNIVGTGYYEEDLLNKINKINQNYEDSCIKFIGNRPDLWNIINEYDIIIGMGRVVLEGLVCKKIVILSGVDGIKDVVNPNNFYEFLKTNFSGRGFLNKDYNELINEINKIKNQDIEKLYNIVKNDFSSRKWVLEYENIYNTVNNVNFEKKELIDLLINIIENFIYSKRLLLNNYKNCQEILDNIHRSKFWKIYILFKTIKNLIINKMKYG